MLWARVLSLLLALAPPSPPPHHHRHPQPKNYEHLWQTIRILDDFWSGSPPPALLPLSPWRNLQIAPPLPPPPLPRLVYLPPSLPRRGVSLHGGMIQTSCPTLLQSGARALHFPLNLPRSIPQTSGVGGGGIQPLLPVGMYLLGFMTP